MDNITNLLEESSVQEYLKLLHTQGFHEESKELKSFVEILDTMDHKYNDILMELKEVKNTLQTLQNLQTKSLTNKAIELVESQIEHGKTQLTNLKSCVVGISKETLQSFKTRGKEALINSIEMLKIRPLIGKVHRALYVSLKQLNMCIKNFDYMTMEARQAKQHIKNFSFVMIGKKPITYPMDHLKLNKAQSLLRTIKTKTEQMITGTSGMIHRIDEYKKPSVRGDLKAIACSDKPSINTPKISKENTR